MTLRNSLHRLQTFSERQRIPYSEMKFPEKRKLLFVGVFMNGAERLFHGVIDEVNIFDSAISEEMIADLAVRTADKPAESWTALMDDDGLMYDSASDTTGQLRNGAAAKRRRVGVRSGIRLGAGSHGK